MARTSLPIVGPATYGKGDAVSGAWVSSDPVNGMVLTGTFYASDVWLIVANDVNSDQTITVTNGSDNESGLTVTRTWVVSASFGQGPFILIPLSVWDFGHALVNMTGSAADMRIMAYSGVM